MSADRSNQGRRNAKRQARKAEHIDKYADRAGADSDEPSGPLRDALAALAALYPPEHER